MAFWRKKKPPAETQGSGPTETETTADSTAAQRQTPPPADLEVAPAPPEPQQAPPPRRASPTVPAASSSASPPASTPPAPHRAPPPGAPPTQQPLRPYPGHAPAPYPGPFAAPISASNLPYAPFNNGWHVAKLALTSASLLWCVALIALSISVSVGRFASLFHTATGIYGVSAAVLVLLWDATVLATTLAAARRRARGLAGAGIHPGVVVGVDLCVWLGAVLCTLLSGATYSMAASNQRNCELYKEQQDAGDRTGYGYYYCDQETMAAYSNGTFGGLVLAMCSFFGLLTLTHFVLFVRACIETNQRRSQLVLVVPPPGSYPLSPNTYPMMPVQPYPGYPPPQPQPRPQVDEKTAARTAQAVDNYNNLAGYFAPLAPPAQAPTAPRGLAEANYAHLAGYFAPPGPAHAR